MFILTYIHQTRTTLLKWEGTEVDSHHSDFNEAALKEVEENQSFMQFIESYERSYMHSEEHNEPGGCVGNAHLLVGVVKPRLPN